MSAYTNVVVEGQDMRPSQHDYDWLGNGMYFWENSYSRALEWARTWHSDAPAVIGAVIDLGHCLDLTEHNCIQLVSDEYRLLRADCEALNIDIPRNHGKTKDRLFRCLDCAVIEHLHSRYDTDKKLDQFDSVRGMFIEGEPAYPEAGIYEKTHVQLCVRNPNCIKGYFRPREMTRGWRNP